MDNDFSENNVPMAMFTRVQQAYKNLYQQEGEEPELDEDGEPIIPNPIVKVPLSIYPIGGNLFVDEVTAVQQAAAGQIPQQDPGNVGGLPPGAGVPAGNAAGGGGVAPPAGGYANHAGRGLSIEQYNHILQQIHQLRTTITHMHTQIDAALAAQRNYLDGRLTTLNNNVRHFGGDIRGAFVRGANRNQAQQNAQQEDQPGDGEAAGAATLYPRPTSLMQLWTEYNVGIGGRKPAKFFTAQERNRVLPGDNIRQKYYRRKVLWDMVQRKVNGGMTAQQACHQICQVYGFQCSVTQVLNFMLHDRTHRPQHCHPNLV
jgi:hypothetical protein